MCSSDLMFSQFGQNMNPASRRLMIALTGAGISIAVIGMSAYMIIKTSQELEAAKVSVANEL